MCNQAPISTRQLAVQVPLIRFQPGPQSHISSRHTRFNYAPLLTWVGEPQIEKLYESARHITSIIELNRNRFIVTDFSR